NFFVRINFADIPQPRNENAALGAGNHLLSGLLSAGRDKHQVGRRFAYLIGQRKSMAGYLDISNFTGIFGVAYLFGGAAGIHEVLDYAFLDQCNFFSMDALAIEWRSGLERMVNVIHDGDV